MSEQHALVLKEGNKYTAATEEGLALITRLMASGHNLPSVATALGISKATLQALRKRDDRVQQAYEDGLGAFEVSMVGHLARAAEKGNVAAAMFLLKTKCGYREQGPTEDTPRSNITINLPGALSMDDYEKVIEVKAETNDHS